MSRATAMAEARRLKAVCERYGVKTSIELQTGRNGVWDGKTRFVASLAHHVASRRSQGLTPFLHLCKVGRSDLAGPLCNGYGGFDQVFRIITLDRANHAGRGGPWATPGFVIPQNSGSTYMFGTEFEGGYTMADWPVEHRSWMSRVLAAQLEWMGRDERSHGEHGNPWARGRKFDRIHYYTRLNTARAEIRAVLGGEPVNLEATMFCALGDENEAVELLQIQLRALGYYEGKIDRKYGPKTSAGVLAMRKSQGSKATSGDSYTAWAYWQMQRALAEHFDADQRARITTLESIHPHTASGDVVSAMPDEFTAHIRVVK